MDAETEQRVRESFAKQRAMETIGAVLAALRPGEVDIRLPFDARLTQQHGFIHAGIVAAIADNACGYAALSLMPPDTAVLTTEFKMNLLSPAQGDYLLAKGRVVRPGKRLMVCMAEVFAHAGAVKQVALMTASMMVLDTATGLRD